MELDEAYVRYFTYLVNFSVGRCGGREQAEDIVQDVFVELFALELTDVNFSYLKTRLTWRLQDFHRRPKSLSLENLIESSGVGMLPTTDLPDSEIGVTLRACLQEPAIRKMLRTLGPLSGSLKQRVVRARRRVREKLADTGVY